ncbi:hypothetical protein WJX81_004521 [Elliptochloris bilobata]|uniref:N-acetyltransferase domain-containing protein n=1 Tax=Elliptochloris bilobata TaxID=381761 RepID=A0AAW1S699_9CHLO
MLVTAYCGFLRSALHKGGSLPSGRTCCARDSAGQSQTSIRRARKPDIAAIRNIAEVADELQVLELAVLPEFRRRGVGTELVRELVRGSCRAGGTVLLEVRAGNAAAVALYQQRLGFATVGRRRGYYADGEDALLMAMPLLGSIEAAT